MGSRDFEASGLRVEGLVRKPCAPHPETLEP